VILFFVPVGDLVGALASTMVSQHARAVAGSTLAYWRWERNTAECTGTVEETLHLRCG